MIIVRLPELCVRFDDDYKRDEIGRFSAGGASPIGKNDYARYSHSTDPMSEWGHAMFAEGDASSGYGPEKFTINEDANLVYINDLKQQIEDAAEKHDLPNGYDSVKDLISAANPSNIVDSAQLWDDPDGFQWMWEHVLEPNGISGITTRDGAIVFDPKMISHSRLDYSEDQPRDKKGRFSSDPTHVRLSVAEKAHLVSTSRAGGDVGKRATEALAMHKKGFHGEARKHLAEIKKTHPVLEVQARGPVPVPALQEHAKGPAAAARPLVDKIPAPTVPLHVAAFAESQKTHGEAVAAKQAAEAALAARTKAEAVMAKAKMSLKAAQDWSTDKSEYGQEMAKAVPELAKAHAEAQKAHKEATATHATAAADASAKLAGAVKAKEAAKSALGALPEHEQRAFLESHGAPKAAAPAPKAVPKPAPATFAPAPKTWFNPKKSYESGSEEAEDASFHGGSYYHGSPGRR